MIKLSEIKWIGFDVDGTLYPNSSEINDRIREEISKKILEKKPELENIESAKNYFEEEYKTLGSGSKILRKIGYDNPNKVMDFCQVNAEVTDLIEPNPKLAEIMLQLKNKYNLFLLSSSPERLTLKKLKKIGIGPEYFSITVYNDTPNCGSKSDGTAFDFTLRKINCPVENQIYIGDSLKKDILPAKKRGMKTIAVGSTIEEADISILNINELGRILL
jgi:FMN phosphatase YigB (HAD superfamily)